MSKVKKSLEKIGVKLVEIDLDVPTEVGDELKDKDICFYCKYWCPMVVDKARNRFSHLGLCENHEGKGKKTMKRFDNTCKNGFKRWTKEEEAQEHKLYT